MRTVTFSDAKVAAALSRDFVSTWKNIRPDKKFPVGTNEKLDAVLSRNPRAEVLSEGTGATNISALFALPDGRIVHAVRGYVTPDRFADEIAFALEAAQAARGKDPAPSLSALYERRMKMPERSALDVKTLGQLARSPLPSIRDLEGAISAGLK